METEPEFNFDLDEMKKAVSSPMVEIPECIEDIDAFDEWLNVNF